ncbi:hypothetical protein THTE_0418 [Thermogutta terrifontis]|uniref:Uncharacterized protein n=1 Tax=Thermogutta terrifontis TaxID=1331910 RepID=A0A286RAP3_9BACT|nr:hypothetical protein THTE_0418 [Thermogutta terrifontis]
MQISLTIARYEGNKILSLRRGMKRIDEGAILILPLLLTNAR